MERNVQEAYQQSIYDQMKKPLPEYLNRKTKTRELFDQLILFYTEERLEQFISILSSPRYSLRIIEWFVTNYCKSTEVFFPRYDDKQAFLCMQDVHQCYKLELDNIHKTLFDPCCRNMYPIYFPFRQDHLLTTIGQLNFFRWFLTFPIAACLEEHYDRNSKHIKAIRLKNNTNKRKRPGEAKTRKKREQLSTSKVIQSFVELPKNHVYTIPFRSVAVFA